MPLGGDSVSGVVYFQPLTSFVAIMALCVVVIFAVTMLAEVYSGPQQCLALACMGAQHQNSVTLISTRNIRNHCPVK